MIRRDWIRHATGAAFVAIGATRSLVLSTSATATTPIFALRNPGCPCCRGWAEHLREHDFVVHLHDSTDLDAVKARMGVPVDLQSCHTAIVEGYIIEGHVPGEFIRELLTETPAVDGIAVAGMPVGSPGMEGRNPEAFDVVAFGAEVDPTQYVMGTVRPE